MKLNYNKPKGQRLKSRFRDVYVDTPKELEHKWCSHKDGKWYNLDSVPKEKGFSTHSHESIRSIKAFKRYIHKHKNEFEKGTILVLISDYVGYDVEYRVK